MCGPSGDGPMNYEDYRRLYKQFKIPIYFFVDKKMGEKL